MNKIVVGVIIGFCLLLGVYLKNEKMSETGSDNVTGQNLPSVVEKKASPSSKDADGRLIGTVKAGQVSEKIWIASKRFYISPAGSGVSYRITDMRGRVSLVHKAADWTDKDIIYVEFVSPKTDITYMIEDWK